MNRREALEIITEICRNVFDDDNLVITETLSAADVASWDSLTHLVLVNEIEEAFQIEFTLDEVTKSSNIGELLNALMKHVNKKEM